MVRLQFSWLPRSTRPVLGMNRRVSQFDGGWVGATCRLAALRCLLRSAVTRACLERLHSLHWLHANTRQAAARLAKGPRAEIAQAAAHGSSNSVEHERAPQRKQVDQLEHDALAPVAKARETDTEAAASAGPACAQDVMPHRRLASAASLRSAISEDLCLAQALQRSDQSVQMCLFDSSAPLILRPLTTKPHCVPLESDHCE